MIRIWEGDYVRISSYQREISSWLDIKFSDQSKIDKKSNQLFFEDEVQYNDFVKIAESIIINESTTITNDQIGKILITKPYTFGLIKIVEPDLKEFADIELECDKSKVKILKPEWI